MIPNDDMPRQPDEDEPLEHEAGDVLDFIDETAAQITDADIDEHLRKVLDRAGYSHDQHTDPSLRFNSIMEFQVGSSQDKVADLIAAATRMQVEPWCERLRQAQQAIEDARREADLIVAEAHEEADEALSQAAKMVRDAREQAGRIISDARREARQIQLSWMRVIEADHAPEVEVGEPPARAVSLRPQDQPDILYVGKILQPARGNTLFAMADVAVTENYDLAAMEGADVGRTAALGLLHDSPETRIGDVPSVKRACVTTDRPEVISARQAADMPKEMNGFLTVTPAEWSADRAVTEMYSLHYRALVRLAALLVRDTPTAEEVVQDSFVAMHGGWQRLRNAEKGLAYLRQAVVNRARSMLRHRTVADKELQKAQSDMPNAEHGALVLLERHAVVAALRKLPERQREAIVLRYYADLSEAEIATAMGISRGAVKSHTARGMTALRAALEQE